MIISHGLKFESASDMEIFLSVQRLLAKFSAKFDAENPMADILHLEAGMEQSHVFAVALGQAAQQPYSISIAIRNDMNKNGDLIGTSRNFAHAVVNINGQNYDSNGINAIELLEALYHPDMIAAVSPENDGSYSKFEWFEIKDSPSTEQVIDAIRVKGLECDDPDGEMVNYLKEIFSESPKSPTP